MNFAVKIKVFMLPIYFLLLSSNKTFVLCHYPSDYSDLENAISKDGNPYYPSNTWQNENSDPDPDIGETVIIDSIMNQ